MLLKLSNGSQSVFQTLRRFRRMSTTSTRGVDLFMLMQDPAQCKDMFRPASACEAFAAVKPFHTRQPQTFVPIGGRIIIRKASTEPQRLKFKRCSSVLAFRMMMRPPNADNNRVIDEVFHQ